MGSPAPRGADTPRGAEPFARASLVGYPSLSVAIAVGAVMPPTSIPDPR
jgi:hypothetical protein